MKVSRKQFPIIPVFACTNYKCQGDTLTSAIVDLPSGKPTYTAAAAYVSFSRVKKGCDVHVLREFTEKVIQRKVPDHKMKQMTKLEKRQEKTEKYLGKKHKPRVLNFDALARKKKEDKKIANPKSKGEESEDTSESDDDASDPDPNEQTSDNIQPNIVEPSQALLENDDWMLEDDDWMI
jgi:hypothetical protein